MIKLLAVNLNFDNLVRLGVWKAVGHIHHFNKIFNLFSN